MPVENRCFLAARTRFQALVVFGRDALHADAWPPGGRPGIGMRSVGGWPSQSVEVTVQRSGDWCGRLAPARVARPA
jgi:hypothetical protein